MSQNPRHKPQRIYARVRSSFDCTGHMKPSSIIWTDGRVYRIEKIRNFRPAHTVYGLPGDCYTVVIREQM